MTSRRKVDRRSRENKENEELELAEDYEISDDDSNFMPSTSTLSKFLIKDSSLEAESSTTRNTNYTNPEIKSMKEIKKKNKQQNEKQNSIFFYITVLIIFTMGIIAMLIYPFSSKPTIKKAECLFNKELDPAGNLCKRLQNRTCRVLTRGIELAVLKPQKPQMFVFLAHLSQKKDVQCFSIKIAKLTNCPLNSNSSIILAPKDLPDNTDDIISMIQPLIKEHKTVVFKDLLSMDISALLALHNLCDIYNPLVTPAIYITNIFTDQSIDFKDLRNMTQIINKLLMNKLAGNMDQNKIKPLITRITDGPILPILPEYVMENFEECSSLQDSSVIY